MLDGESIGKSQPYNKRLKELPADIWISTALEVSNRYVWNEKCCWSEYIWKSYLDSETSAKQKNSRITIKIA